MKKTLFMCRVDDDFIIVEKYDDLDGYFVRRYSKNGILLDSLAEGSFENAVKMALKSANIEVKTDKINGGID